MGKGGHGGGFVGNGHSHDADNPEDTWNLYQHIERCEGLNCTTPTDAPGECDSISELDVYSFGLNSNPSLVRHFQSSRSSLGAGPLSRERRR